MKVIEKLVKVSLFAAGLAALTIGKANAIPTGTITSPVNGGYTVGALSATGTCVPSAGTTITDVRLQMRRNDDNMYWKYSTRTWETSASNWIPASISGNTWSVAAADLPRRDQPTAELLNGNYLLTLEITDSASAHNATPYPKVYWNSYHTPIIKIQHLGISPTRPSHPRQYADFWDGYFSIGSQNPPVGAAAPALDRVEYDLQRSSDNKYWNHSTMSWQVAPYKYIAPVSGTSFVGDGKFHDEEHGTHTFHVTVWDVDGNSGSDSESFTR